MDGTSVEDLKTGVNAKDVAVDEQNRKLYWSEPNVPRHCLQIFLRALVKEKIVAMDTSPNSGLITVKGFGAGRRT